MLRAAPGEAFGPFTLLRSLSDQGFRQRWIACHTDDTAREPYLLEVLPGPMAEHRCLPRPVREEMAHLRAFKHPRFAPPGRMALTRSHIGFSFQLAGTRTLEELLATLVKERAPMPPSAAVELIIKVAEALEAFHGRPAGGRASNAHLSIRPAHIFLAPGGEVVITGAWVEALERLWPWGAPESSLPYIAPERVRGDDGTVASDLYALGRILRECLSLRPSKVAARELILGYLQKEPEAPRLQSLLDVPLLQAVIAELLSSDPGARPDSADDLVETLKVVQRTAGVEPSLEAFLLSIGWRDMDLSPDLPIPTDGLATEEFPPASSLRLADEIRQRPPPESPYPGPEGELDENLTIEEALVEDEDPFASLEAALSDLEVTFSDFEMPDGVPEGEGAVGRPVKMGALRGRKLPDGLGEDIEPSLTSVVVDISDLLPEDAVKPLDGDRERKPLAFLLHTLKDASRTRYPLDGTPVTIGRSPSNTVHITGDGRVSRLHCRITMEDGEFVLEDAGSNNGTLVDGVFVKRQALAGGEEIIIGGTVLQFVISEKWKTITPPF